MRWRISAESTVAGLAFLMCLFFGYQSLHIQAAAARYPQLIIVILGMLAVIVFVKGMNRTTKWEMAINIPRLIRILGLLILYIVSYNFLDFRLSTFLFFFLFLLGTRLAWPIWQKVLLAAGMSLLLYVGFALIFAVPLP